ncbi:hypothetical protein NUW54_g10598 [Trametes sanguinea]|uniref:Uncharacterized protein n=1 Tax=Trametes sanguinea TaxID=158606 RepID=A0ACC1NWL7_9APHY|nr:hypothetical protein NUW54_g10598 [Trametes sanguinea]
MTLPSINPTSRTTPQPTSSSGRLLQFVGGLSSLTQVLWHELGYAGHTPTDFAEVCPEFVLNLRILVLLVNKHGLVARRSLIDEFVLGLLPTSVGCAALRVTFTQISRQVAPKYGSVHPTVRCRFDVFVPQNERSLQIATKQWLAHIPVGYSVRGGTDHSTVVVAADRPDEHPDESLKVVTVQDSDVAVKSFRGEEIGGEKLYGIGHTTLRIDQDGFVLGSKVAEAMIPI